MELKNSKSDIEKGHIIMNTSTSISSSKITTEYSDETDYISEIQPSIHENKKSCCEFFLKSIFIIPNRDLTQNEYSKLNILRKECITIYDEKIEKHEMLLADLLDTYVELCKENNKEFKNKPVALWKEIGFQGDNPRTDFRAGGLYSLKFMHYFAWKYTEDLAESVDLDYFSFAVVSIRLTFMFKLFLNLIKDDELEISLKSHKINSCTRNQFKNFCRYLNYNQDILIYFLAKSFIYIKNKFREQADKSKNELNFLLIDPLIKKALKYFGYILNQKLEPDDVENFVQEVFENDIFDDFK